MATLLLSSCCRQRHGCLRVRQRPSHLKRLLQQKLLAALPQRLQLLLEEQAGHALAALHWLRWLVVLKQTLSGPLRARQPPICRSACGSRLRTALTLPALAGLLLLQRLLLLVQVSVVPWARQHPSQSRCHHVLRRSSRRQLSMRLPWLALLRLRAAAVQVRPQALELKLLQVAQLQEHHQSVLKLTLTLVMRMRMRMTTWKALLRCSRAAASSASCSRCTLALWSAACCLAMIIIPSTSPSRTGRHTCGWCVGG